VVGSLDFCLATLSALFRTRAKVSCLASPQGRLLLGAPGSLISFLRSCELMVGAWTPQLTASWWWSTWIEIPALILSGAWSHSCNIAARLLLCSFELRSKRRRLSFSGIPKPSGGPFPMPGWPSLIATCRTASAVHRSFFRRSSELVLKTSPNGLVEWLLTWGSPGRELIRINPRASGTYARQSAGWSGSRRSRAVMRDADLSRRR
jgi:hypothetical protein